MTNETIASQLAHRTIRAYKDQPLTEEEVMEGSGFFGPFVLRGLF